MWGGGSGPTIVWGVWRVMSAPGWWGRAPLLWQCCAWTVDGPGGGHGQRWAKGALMGHGEGV